MLPCGLCSASYLSLIPSNKKARWKKCFTGYQLAVIVRNLVFNQKIFNSMYKSRDQEKTKCKGVNQLQWPHCHSFRHIFPFSRTDNVTTCIAWTFPLTGKTLVKPLRLSTWLTSASQDCHIQTLLGFPHREWSKFNLRWVTSGTRPREGIILLHNNIFSCPYPLLQERK